MFLSRVRLHSSPFVLKPSESVMFNNTIIFSFLIGFLFSASLNSTLSLAAESFTSSNCLTVYQEGGAEAVIQSPRCAASVTYAPRRSHGHSNCQVATLQGRRKFQEDRAVCATGIKIPFLGKISPLMIF